MISFMYYYTSQFVANVVARILFFERIIIEQPTIDKTSTAGYPLLTYFELRYIRPSQAFFYIYFVVCLFFISDATDAQTAIVIIT